MLLNSVELLDYIVFTIFEKSFLYCANIKESYPISDCSQELLKNVNFSEATEIPGYIKERFSEKEIAEKVNSIHRLYQMGKISRRKNAKHFINLKPDTITIKLIPTRRCNLSCSYCFSKNKSAEWDMSIETAKAAIDYFLSEFYSPSAKVTVDLSGAGEPLMRLDFIIALNEYLLQLKTERGINIFIQFASNGMLLTPETSRLLKESMIMFGVSLDGDEAVSAKARKGIKYELVVNNIKSMTDKRFFGIASTFSGINHDIISIFENLYQLEPEVVSIKPVRSLPDEDGAINSSNVEGIKLSYNDFCEWLLKKLADGKEQVFRAIVNGDDFFGKFLRNLQSPAKTIKPCYAGVDSISVDAEGNILICPAFINHENTFLGNIRDGVDKNKLESLINFYTDNIEYCKDCWARYTCGGECFAVSYNNFNEYTKPDQVMCELKKHLIQLSIFFWHTLANEQPLMYKRLKGG